MVSVERYRKNPVLKPNKKNSWEKEAAFNPCVVEKSGKFHMLYRALSSVENHHGVDMEVSSIGHASGSSVYLFPKRKQLIKPKMEWEKYGCEDPRVTKFGNSYYIFYTALSNFPFSPEGIKIGVAKTRDFESIQEKHLVTHFNSKAMALFPEKIGGKIVAILTVHTDKPPAKICLACFEDEKQIISKGFWDKWYEKVNFYDIHLLRSADDHLEVGAPPVKTPYGWLIIYSYIRNYLKPPYTFGIEAALLDLNDPFCVVGRTDEPLLVPEKDYELYGKVPNVIFPSGSLIRGGELYIFYGAADTTACVAKCNLKKLLDGLRFKQVKNNSVRKTSKVYLERYEGNPIISPIPEHTWESQATFNPAAIYLDSKVHILYRAMSKDNTSVFGYASSSDGFIIDERLEHPVYTPRMNFEIKANHGNSGCEDPRITKIGDTLYMCYTAYNGIDHTKVALSKIKADDMINKNFQFSEPEILSLPGRDDKNSCVLSKKHFGRFVVLHRMYHNIWIDFLEDLNGSRERRLMGTDWIKRKKDSWDSEKIGIGGPPIETTKGWLLIYHGLSTKDLKYRLGALLLARENPAQVISRLPYPILEPEENYENDGIREGTVFACGSVIINGRVFVYYGGADKVVCVATIYLDKLLDALAKNIV